jgi:aryl-alcohol dehydrogenase-like predicted oxidoreductase
LHETASYGPPVEDERLYRVVASVILGARNEEQLRQNLGAIGWSLTTEQVKGERDKNAR